MKFEIKLRVKIQKLTTFNPQSSFSAFCYSSRHCLNNANELARDGNLLSYATFRYLISTYFKVTESYMTRILSIQLHFLFFLNLFFDIHAVKKRID